MSSMRQIITILLLSACLHIPALTVFANETPSGIPFSELESRIDEIVARYLNQTTPGAAIVVVKDGEIVFSRGYGYANTESRTPVDPAATVFEFGSTGKTVRMDIRHATCGTRKAGLGCGHKNVPARRLQRPVKF